MRTGFLNPTQAVAEAVEDVAESLAGRDMARQFGNGQQGLADGFGGDAGVGEGCLELGVGLGVRIDESANVLFQRGMEFLGRLASPQFVSVLAADAGAKFVQSGVDG